MKKKLRIGLLIDNHLIPAWVYKMLEKINSSEYADIVLIVRKKKIEQEKNIFNRILGNRKQALLIGFQKLENKIFHISPDANELKEVRKIVNCTEIEVSTKETKFNDIILQDDIEKISSHTVDVLVKLGFKKLQGKILNSSKYGVWAFCHVDSDANTISPAGFWEVYERSDETRIVLQILTNDKDEGIMLSESFSATDKLSPKRNENNYYWKACLMLPRKLNELYSLGADDFFQRVNNNSFCDKKLYKPPTNLNAFRTYGRIFIQHVLIKIEKLFYVEQWGLSYKIESKNKLSTSFSSFKKMFPSKDRFWADPFIMERNGKYFVFFEELIYKENVGNISVFEIDKEGNYTAPQLVLKKDYHLSYPFLFEENGELYMIPETAANKTIELYKCLEFPLKWELRKILMKDVFAVDSTIIKKDNRYWLFCNIKENEGISICDELFLFYSDSLLSDNWVSHPANPIVSDIKNSRPAGNIFHLDNKLYRPAQNCAKHYGHGMRINEIVELNEKTYREKTVQSIFPDWEKDIFGTHTINNLGKLTVIDAIIKRRK